MWVHWASCAYVMYLTTPMLSPAVVTFVIRVAWVHSALASTYLYMVESRGSLVGDAHAGLGGGAVEYSIQ